MLGQAYKDHMSNTCLLHNGLMAGIISIMEFEYSAAEDYKVIKQCLLPRFSESAFVGILKFLLFEPFSQKIKLLPRLHYYFSQGEAIDV